MRRPTRLLALAALPPFGAGPSRWLRPWGRRSAAVVKASITGSIVGDSLLGLGSLITGAPDHTSCVRSSTPDFTSHHLTG